MMGWEIAAGIILALGLATGAIVKVNQFFRTRAALRHLDDLHSDYPESQDDLYIGLMRDRR